MAARLFEDFGKEPKDVLDKGFPTNGTLKVSVETKTPNNVTIVGTGQRTVRVKDDKYTEVISASVEPKFDWKDQNIEFSSKIANGSVLEGEVAFKDLGTTGTKLSFKGASDEVGPTTTAAFSYRSIAASLKASITYPFTVRKPARFNAGTVLVHQRYLVGAEATYETLLDKDDKGKDPVPRVTANGALGYVGDNYEAQLTVRNFPLKDEQRDNEFGFLWFQKISDLVKLSINFSVQQSTAVTSTSVAAEYKYDALTTLKGKYTVKDVDNRKDFRVFVGATHKLSPHITTTVGADLNVLKLLGNNVGADPSFGLEVKFS